MRHAKQVMAPVLATGLLLTAWSGTTAQSAAPAECDYTDATPVTVQLQWVAQAQFAGYYAAKDLCYYAEQGINVDARRGRPDGHASASHRLGPERSRVRGRAGSRRSSSCATRASPTWSTSRRSSSARERRRSRGPTAASRRSTDFAGKVVGVWPFGNEYEVTAAIKAAGIA